MTGVTTAGTTAGIAGKTAATADSEFVRTARRPSVLIAWLAVLGVDLIVLVVFVGAVLAAAAGCASSVLRRSAGAQSLVPTGRLILRSAHAIRVRSHGRRFALVHPGMDDDCYVARQEHLLRLPSIVGTWGARFHPLMTRGALDSIR